MAADPPDARRDDRPRGRRIPGASARRAAERDDFREFVGFRDALRADADLRDGYIAAKRSVLAGAHGPIDGRRYSTAKSPFVEDALFSHGIRRVPADRPAPLAPGATIGILGGGQLGRMLALAARTLGYRVVILDLIPPARGRRGG